MTVDEGSQKLAAAVAGAEQPADGPPAHAADPMQKYNEERNKRLNKGGVGQYIDLATSDTFKSYQDDPWLDEAADSLPALKDGDHCKYLILGAGFGGLLFAVRLLQAGIDARDIRMVDSAGGFGGTWYWNRYPGLMCDIESYIYLPLLEETGYMPKHKYSYGPEILTYANRIADEYGLRDKAAFQMQTESLTWDEEAKDWEVKLVYRRTSMKKGSDVAVRAQFVIVASGLLNNPKLPGLKGIEDFKGHSFHTSRWDYKYTGGTPSEPSLTSLRDKRVGIIGTGATCIQALPHLSRWAKEVYVFQRTPSSVDVRGQKPTDAEWFSKQLTAEAGWQKDRTLNFNAHMSNTVPRPEADLVDDGWTHMPSFSALLGGPAGIGLTPEKIPEYVGGLHAIDYPRQEGLRQRVASVVNDQSVAAKLKPYYAGWCKRPCFHDDYLASFNKPNVHLIDTDGKGVDGLTSTSVIANDKDYPIDCLIFSTGFRSPALGTPASRAGITVIGRNGLSLDQKWEKAGVASLHGICSRDFPNLFFPGPIQAGVSANQMFVLSILSEHVAHIIVTAQAKAGEGKTVLLEPTTQAEEEWSMRTLQGAMTFSALMGCTPGWINMDGDMDKIIAMGQEAQMKAGRGGTWGPGVNDFARIIEKWRDGKLTGLEVSVV